MKKKKDLFPVQQQVYNLLNEGYTQASIARKLNNVTPQSIQVAVKRLIELNYIKKREHGRYICLV